MKNRAKMALAIWANFAQMPKICTNNYKLKDETTVSSTFIAMLRIQRAVVPQLMSIKDIQGLRFTKDGLTFKASQIKRDLTFANIVRYLDGNANKEQEAKTAYQQQTRQNDQPIQEPNPKREEHQEESHHHSSGSSISIPSLGLFGTSNPVYDPEDEDFRRRLQQKKKKKRGPRL